MKGKSFFATLIAVAAAYQFAKGLVFGRPVSKVRKAVVYSALGLTLFYQGCKTQIYSGVDKVDLYIQSYVDKKAQRKSSDFLELSLAIDSLQSKLKVKEDLLEKVDSYARSNTYLEGKVSDLERRVSLQQRVVVERPLASQITTTPSMPRVVRLEEVQTNIGYEQEEVRLLNSDVREEVQVRTPRPNRSYIGTNIRTTTTANTSRVVYRQYESLTDFVQRKKNPETERELRRYTNELVRYNTQKGNQLRVHYSANKTKVYLPEGWSN